MADHYYHLALADGRSEIVPEYEPSEYFIETTTRRASATQTLSGVVHQDFGLNSQDGRIRARWGWMSASEVASFQTKYALTGTVLEWGDREADYLVFFSELRLTPIRGQEAYEVEMVFRVLGEVA